MLLLLDRTAEPITRALQTELEELARITKGSILVCVLTPPFTQYIIRIIQKK